MADLYDINDTFIGEMVEYQRIKVKTNRTTTGSYTYTNSLTSASYTSANGGEASVMLLIKAAIDNFLVTAAKFNAKADTTTVNAALALKLDTSEVVTSAQANKVLKLNGSSKLPASITGDADTLDSYHAANTTGAIPISNGIKNTDLNADKVDGFNAAQVPAANEVIVLGVDNSNTDGGFYKGTTNPTGTSRLNYSGELRATKIYGGTFLYAADETEVSQAGITETSVKTFSILKCTSVNLNLTRLTIVATLKTTNASGATNLKVYIDGSGTASATLTSTSTSYEVKYTSEIDISGWSDNSEHTVTIKIYNSSASYTAYNKILEAYVS